ncbi:MAG: flagellar biosynthetic protein FliR [Spirochaetia bacterium]
MGSFFNHDILVFFLVFARCIALIEVLPVITSSGIPFAGRAGLAFFTTAVIAPVVVAAGYPIIAGGGAYVFYLLAEVMLGLIQGFFVSIVFSVMHSSGQLFSLQMGLAASEMFDPVSQIELPVMAQFFNLMAFMVFFSSFGLQKVFLAGLQASFQSIIAPDLLWQPEGLAGFFTKSIAGLFGQAIVIAMPLISTLFLVTVVMGLLNKAAPQMNLMMLGFPLQLGIGYLLIVFALPNILNAFESLLTTMWEQFPALFRLFKN